MLLVRIFKKIITKIIVLLFGNKTWLLSDVNFTKCLFYFNQGYKINFKNPKTFSENICVRKVMQDEFYLWKYTDKYKVREYVQETIGKKYLNNVLGIYSSFSEIDFDQLPNRFVLKATHGSGYNVLVKDKEHLELKIVEKKFKKWLKRNYYYSGREKNYYLIKPRIICDEFIQPKKDEYLTEVKVFCFKGKVKLISIIINIGDKIFSNQYNQNWNFLNVKMGYPIYRGFKLPKNKNEIIQVAENLSCKFDFVRTDLYLVDDCIIFSELTFHPGGGLVKFDPPEFDLYLGNYFSQFSIDRRFA